MVFIPTAMQRPRKPTSTCYCQWCATRGMRKAFYKLRDGPVDWYFCNDDHALEWLDHRHKNSAINAVLKLRPGPRQRVLQGMTIAEFCSVQLSQEDE